MAIDPNHVLGTPFTAAQLAFGALTALVVGFSKTGVPGVGILSVPLMAFLFPGRLSAGALLPMLIVADTFAVAYYRAHTDWSRLGRLMPWVATGMVIGFGTLFWLGRTAAKDPLNQVIGAIVLAMLALHFLRGKLGDRLLPTAPAGVAATGALAGFTTFVSNAAGPVMAIYWTAVGMAKREFMGTSAWYFFILNTVKLPFYFLLSYLEPETPMLTAQTLQFDLLVAPFIALGALIGRRSLPHIPQGLFTNTVLALAAVSAFRLLFG